MGVERWCSRNSEPALSEDIAADSPDLPLSATIEAGSDGSVSADVPDLREIAAVVKKCSRCELSRTRNQAVPGSGNSAADWMFIGEAPGQNEDEQGLPFVGRAGKLLDAMIKALGMSREDVFIANVVKCRPPGNRDPLPEEITNCQPYLQQQLDLVRPKVIVALGRISAQALLSSAESLGSMRGQVYEYGKQATPLVVTYHPAYLLRSPEQKNKAWQDLLMAKALVRTAV